MDAFLLEAMREVDAMLPGTTPIAPPACQQYRFRRENTKPPGSTYSYFTDSYVRQGQRVSREEWIHYGFGAAWRAA